MRRIVSSAIVCLFVCCCVFILKSSFSFFRISEVFFFRSIWLENLEKVKEETALEDERRNEWMLFCAAEENWKVFHHWQRWEKYQFSSQLGWNVKHNRDGTLWKALTIIRIDWGKWNKVTRMKRTTWIFISKNFAKVLESKVLNHFRKFPKFHKQKVNRIFFFPACILIYDKF